MASAHVDRLVVPSGVQNDPVSLFMDPELELKHVRLEQGDLVVYGVSSSLLPQSVERWLYLAPHMEQVQSSGQLVPQYIDTLDLATLSLHLFEVFP